MARGKRRGRPAWGKIAAAAVAIAALAAMWRYTPLSDYLTMARVSAWARSVREVPWAPFALALAYTPASLLMFPRPLLTLFAVIAFGPWIGFASAMSGIILAALVTYYAGRVLPERFVERVAGDKLERVQKELRRHGLRTVFLVRLVPIAPFAVEGIAAGAARVKLWHYTLGTFLAMAPAVMAETVFGSQISAMLDEASEMNYWIAGGAVLVMIALTLGVAWWRKH